MFSLQNGARELFATINALTVIAVIQKNATLPTTADALLLIFQGDLT
jgi:hypothetical protein